MTLRLTQLAWLLAAGSTLAGAWSHKSREQLDELIGGDGMALVAFVAPSSQSPKSDNLDWEWRNIEVDIPTASIDCTAAGNPCDGFGVESLPTIRLYQNRGQHKEYTGPRRTGAIVQYLQRQLRPVVSELVGREALEFFTIADEVVFVAYLRDDDDAGRAAFTREAERYRDEFTFGVVGDPVFMASAEIAPPTVICYKPGDEASETYTGGFADPAAFPAWLLEASRQVIMELTPANHQRVLDRAWPVVYVFAASTDERQRFRRTLKRFAKSYYDSLTSVTADPLDFPDLPARLGLEPGRFPAGAVHQVSKDRVYPYPYDRGMTSNDLTKWGIDVWQGRIKPWTPPGVTTTYDDLGPTRVAKRTVSVKKIPGVGSAIKIAGLNHDEL